MHCTRPRRFDSSANEVCEVSAVLYCTSLWGWDEFSVRCRCGVLWRDETQCILFWHILVAGHHKS